MKATFALLLPRPVENAVARIAWEVHRRWRTGVGVRRLPPHISLKQPFEIGENLEELERYFTGLAAETLPLPLSLSGYYAWESVFGFAVQETPELRALHDRLNQELPALFGDVRAPFDGAGYQFHLTITAGGATPETYCAIHSAYREESHPAPFLARELALFVYDESAPGHWEYMMHTVLPLVENSSRLF